MEDQPHLRHELDGLHAIRVVRRGVSARPRLCMRAVAARVLPTLSPRPIQARFPELIAIQTPVRHDPQQHQVGEDRQVSHDEPQSVGRNGHS